VNAERIELVKRAAGKDQIRRFAERIKGHPAD
jgi:hypothetical protein